MTEDLLMAVGDAAEAAAKRAKQAAVLAVLAVAVAIAVLAIDNGIKRAILAEAAKARDLLDEAHTLAKTAHAPKPVEVTDHGQETAGDAGAPAGPGDNGPDVLVDAPGASAATGNHAGPRRRQAARGPDGKFAGSRGDG